MSLYRYDELLTHLRNVHPNIDITSLSDEQAVIEALTHHDTQNNTTYMADHGSKGFEYLEGILVGISTEGQLP
jgi:hypothetical protein